MSKATENSEEVKSPKVLQVEILPPRDDERNYYQQTGNNFSSPGFGQRDYGPQGKIVWSYSNFNNPGCVAAAITFGIFLILVARYGLLAGIGFFVFHVIGSIINTMLASRALMAGRSYPLWPGRIINWLICALLTIWLAGGDI